MNLVFEQGSLAGQTYPLGRTMVSIGRTGENDLVLPEQPVSRRHAAIQRVPEGWLLTDLGSTNGTYVDGRRIAEPHLLGPGERVTIGDSVFLILENDVPGVSHSDREGGKAGGRSLPLPIVILAAVCAVVLLIGLVLLLVTIFQPGEAPAVPTYEPQAEGLLTALPVPTQMQEVVTSIVPMFSTMLPGFPLGSTATPEPGSSIPGTEISGRPADAIAPAPHPPPSAFSGSRGDRP
jgi:hypothetical protein